MCNMAVCEANHTLQFLPDWFVMPKLVEMWHDNDLMQMMIMSLMSGMIAIKSTKNGGKIKAYLDTVELSVVPLNNKYWTRVKEVWTTLNIT